MQKKSTYLFGILISTCVFISCSNDDNSVIEVGADDDPIVEITVSVEDFSLTIPENQQLGETLGTVIGTTNEGAVMFQLIEETPTGALDINATTGELLVANGELFNFEARTEISGIVKVSNGAISENATILITLSDVAESNIYEGDVHLKTQEEVDEFGEGSYTEITGNLIIGRLDESYSSINDIAVLSTLTTVGESLKILKNATLRTISGLINLTSVKGIELQYNFDLRSLDGLQNTPSVLSGNLIIDGTEWIADLDKLSHITEVGQNLSLQSNTNIWNIYGLSNLHTVLGDISIGRNLELCNITALSNITALGGDLNLSHSYFLCELPNFNIASLSGDIVIKYCWYITNLDGLEGLSSTDGSITIEGNPNLTDLSGLRNFNNVNEGIRVIENLALENLNGLENLSGQINSLEFTGNILLSDFCGIQPLVSSSNFTGPFIANNNAYNPTKQDMIDGNCSL